MTHCRFYHVYGSQKEMAQRAVSFSIPVQTHLDCSLFGSEGMHPACRSPVVNWTIHSAAPSYQL